MKKTLLSLLLFLAISTLLCGCKKDKDEETKGSIYGIVTTTGEPLKGIGVSLYSDDALLLKTVTYDDGSYEFTELTPKTYTLKVEDEEYETFSTTVVVESGRQARADMKLIRKDIHLNVATVSATISENKVLLKGKYTSNNSYSPYICGFYYSQNHNPSNSGTQVTVAQTSNGYFEIEISGLSNGTYYYQAYAKNTLGTAFGNILSFSIGSVDVVEMQNLGLMIQKNDISSGSSWNEAKSLCENSNLGGYTDWRLPTSDELQQLYYNRDVIGNFHTNGGGQYNYWSSTTYYDYHDYYYAINFNYGGCSSYSNYNSFRVRAVRYIEETKLSVTPTCLDFDDCFVTKTCDIQCNRKWTAEASEYWCRVSPSSGSNNGTLSVYSLLPPDSSPRTATVTVTAGTKTCTVNVTQSGYNGGSSGDEFFEGFENDLPSDWITIDLDGDENNWFVIGEAEGIATHGGTKMMTSASYDNDDGVLTPDNWLISPLVALGSGSEFSFYVCAQDADWPSEHFGVAVLDVDYYYTMVWEGTLTAKNRSNPQPGARGQRTQGNWYRISVDLGEYAGQDMHIAIRHFDCTDMYRINVDDVQLSNSKKDGNTFGNYSTWGKTPIEHSNNNRLHIK